MLAALIKQAQQASLTTEPGFAPKEIRWMVNVSGGRLTGVISLVQDRRGRTYPRSPEMGQPEMMALPKAVGKPQAAHFLADTCGVVVLLPALDREGQPKTDAKSVDELAKNTEKHQTYTELLRRASAEVPDFREVLSVLDDPEQLAFLRDELGKAGAKSTDKLSFSVGPTDLLSGDLWHDWWRAFRRETFGREASAGGGMLDFTSGESVTPANTHPKLTKLGVGAIAMGASLVGYDKEAFGSYNLDAGENGVVSEENAAAYRAALDNLLESAPILGQMKVAAWFDHEQAEGQKLIDAIVEPATLKPVVDDLGWDDVDEHAEIVVAQSQAQWEAVARERARQLLTTIRQGEEPPALRAHYYALAVSGASGRAMVRDWKTGTLEELARAVGTWLDDLAIVNTSGKIAKRPKMHSLLMNLQRPKSRETSTDDYLKPVRNLQLPLWRAALDPCLPLPLSAVLKITESHRADVMNGDFNKSLSREGTALMRSRIYTRMALLRAYHQRQARLHRGDPMLPSLNPRHPKAAYHCGRLMYLLAELQKKSAGSREINAGVIQRYYGAASSTPSLVIGRLISLSQHHLNKLSSGYAYWWQGQLGEAMNAIKEELPKTLMPAEQSLFALGYYHQLVFSRSRKSGNPEPDIDISLDAEEQQDSEQ